MRKCKRCDAGGLQGRNGWAARLGSRSSVIAVVVSLALLGAAPVAAEVIETPPEQGIALGTGPVPGATGPEKWTRLGGKLSVRNVLRASLTPVLPTERGEQRTAVIIAPGGAFRTLAMDQEGFAVAHWLADHGIAAFVLKYRLVPTPDDDPKFAWEMAAFMRELASGPGQPDALLAPPYALQDAMAALRLVRARAAEFGVDPALVGMMGFSAGARLTIATAQQSSPADMPAFIAPIYPSMRRVEVPEHAPPMFVGVAIDDPLYGRNGYGLVEGWIAARAKVELHAYQRGGHGYGLGIAGTTSADWLETFKRWLEMNRMVRPVDPIHPAN